MSAQLSPAASQRCHWYAGTSVGEPVQSPSSSVSVWPSRGVPDSDGSTTLTGGLPSTTPVGSLVAVSAPAGFV